MQSPSGLKSDAYGSMSVLQPRTKARIDPMEGRCFLAMPDQLQSFNCVITSKIGVKKSPLSAVDSQVPIGRVVKNLPLDHAPNGFAWSE